MHGNVWEWCQDWDNDRYYAKSPMDDPTGAATGLVRAIRGAGWRYPAWCCRSAYRSNFPPEFGNYVMGLRVCLVPPTASPNPATPKANDPSSKTSATKPAEAASRTSDQPATKEGAKTKLKPAPIYNSTADRPDKHGILHDASGRKIGIWGIDGDEQPKPDDY
jgi:hypothetical protein